LLAGILKGRAPSVLAGPGRLQAAAEAIHVFGRGDEGFDHLGRDVVAVEFVQLAEPEVEARVVRVALQVALVKDWKPRPCANSWMSTETRSMSSPCRLSRPR
jgi:hypothetical protein